MKLGSDVSELTERFFSARALVFDFDGTLVDSNPIKHRAFERCFTGFPDQREEILAYCAGHHHTPRGEKFRHVYEEILHRPYTSELAATLHARFEAHTTQQIIHAPEIPGAAELLQRLQGRYVMAVLSSTPHEVLCDIVARRGWRERFESIQGAPVNKAAWLKMFRQMHGPLERDVIFFGDTLEDCAAAKAAGCLFIAVGEGARSAVGDGVRDFTGLLRAFSGQRGHSSIGARVFDDD